MKDFLDYISNWPVLKWVILVLVAGFIGQFGKMLAEAIILKVRRRRESKHTLPDVKPPQTQNSAPADPVLSVPSAISDEISGKKKLKALAKARKKEAKLK